MINSPHNRDQLETGQNITVLDAGCDDTRMPCVELQLNGELKETGGKQENKKRLLISSGFSATFHKAWREVWEKTLKGNQMVYVLP